MEENSIKTLPEKWKSTPFASFYLVGLGLFILPFTRPLFISITALSLLLVIGVILYYHRNWNKQTVLFFLFIIISSFFFEMAGIRTGKIFGDYMYDRALGIKINGTPLIIGLNWLYLIYATHDIVSRKFSKPVSRILTGALLMVFYDLFLEWVAPYMEMWHFTTGYPPPENFVAWFLASVVFHSGFEILHIQSNNILARGAFGIQLVFFILIGTYSYFFLR
ncbi:MAG: carotenoid biosynthesis protein [Candidatus Azobacteroides sp.]|nr:carotenoid biosynthesis protein [Candidatus Azobacteroides sp.]